MRYVIAVYDASTEKLTRKIEIPTFRHSELGELMSWKAEEDAIHVYDLSDIQLDTIQKWLGEEIRSPGRVIQLAAIA